ncbi:Alpha/Beta hydrolase protein [Xylariaceae sp. AK1471]|nr:Alpha/Beta hydrolase protein [Xylariaceae sp. AK1471]
MPSIKLDPEWEAMWQAFALMPKPVINDVHDLRSFTNTMLATTNLTLQVPEGIEETKHTIPSLDGTNIDIHQFVPPAAASSSAPQRAIVYAFGGGMVGGSINIWRTAIKDLANRTGTQVFAVHYRLAPEHPAPAAVEDFYAAVKWLQTNAAGFNVDPTRIVLNGKSAGGGIAAGAALMARDKGLQYPLAAMALTYPMLDDRTVLPADHPLQQYLTWSALSNDLAWKALLGKEREERTDENVSIYAAPARAKDLSGLPDTLIDVGGLDLFVDEDIAFVAKLVAAGVHVEFHLFPGVPHGFDSARHIRVAQEAISAQTKFLTRY